MKIYGREIGPEHPPYFIAEIGANHDGELDRALRLIELAADAGADAVKFQHFQAETIVSRRGFAELGKLAHQADWKDDVYEVYEKASIPLDWTEHLSSYAHDHGMAFITTPYSLELVDAVEPYVDAYKIGSGDITWDALIDYVSAKGKPVLIATGASHFLEIARAIEVFFGNEGTLVLMHCNTDYSGNEDVLRYSNLNVLKSWSTQWPCGIHGLSDHTSGNLAVCTAIALGARVFEKHFTDDKTRKGPDHFFAIDPYEWCVMQDDAKRVYESLGDGKKKVEENEKDTRVVQRRALRYSPSRGGMRKNQVIRPVEIVATRPCPPGALTPNRLDNVTGRVLTRDVEADSLVSMDDFS